jgi:hypothetical protein
MQTAYSLITDGMLASVSAATTLHTIHHLAIECRRNPFLGFLKII